MNTNNSAPMQAEATTSGGLIVLTRRNILRGVVGLIAAPAIVRVENIMPVFAPKQTLRLHVSADGVNWTPFTEEFLKQIHEEVVRGFMMPSSFIDPARGWRNV